jgi:hypothetical protein
MSNDTMAKRAGNRQGAMPILILRPKITIGRSATSCQLSANQRLALVAEPLNLELVAAFQVEDFTRFVWRRHLEAEAFDDLAGELHLFCIRRRHAPGRGPQ